MNKFISWVIKVISNLTIIRKFNNGKIKKKNHRVVFNSYYDLKYGGVLKELDQCYEELNRE